MELVQILSQQADVIRKNPQIYKIGSDEIKIHPLTVGQLIAISPYLSKIQIADEVKTQQDFFEVVLPKMIIYVEPIKEIFKILIDYEFEKLLFADVCNILILILVQIREKDFLNSITLTKQVSRSQREELIAAAEIFLTQST